VRRIDRQGRHGVVSRAAKPDAAAGVLSQRHAGADDSERRPSLDRNYGVLT
jgi:hypothetical protein